MTQILDLNIGNAAAAQLRAKREVPKVAHPWSNHKFDKRLYVGDKSQRTGGRNGRPRNTNGDR